VDPKNRPRLADNPEARRNSDQVTSPVSGLNFAKHKAQSFFSSIRSYGLSQCRHLKTAPRSQSSHFRCRGRRRLKTCPHVEHSASGLAFVIARSPQNKSARLAVSATKPCASLG